MTLNMSYFYDPAHISFAFLLTSVEFNGMECVSNNTP
jgi:hypothetical protein